MAPRPPPNLDLILRELRGTDERLKTEPYRFGGPNFTHGVVAEDGVFRVRRLSTDVAAMRAYAESARANGKPFLPEHSELFSKPTGEVVLEAPTLEALLAALKARWPLS